MRAMVTTATGAPELMRSAWRMAARGIFSPLEAMSTDALCVGCLSNFRRPNFLRTGEPGAGSVRGRLRPSPSQLGLGLHRGHARHGLRGDHRGPGHVVKVDAAGRTEDQRHRP